MRASFVGDRGANSLRRELVLLNQRFDQDAAHLAGTQNGDAVF